MPAWNCSRENTSRLPSALQDLDIFRRMMVALHFGLGASTHADKLTIHWPSGQEQVLENLSIACSRWRSRSDSCPPHRAARYAGMRHDASSGFAAQVSVSGRARLLMDSGFMLSARRVTNSALWIPQPDEF